MKKRTWIDKGWKVISLGLLLTAPYLYAQENRSDRFRTQAEAFFYEGNNAKALEYYQKALKAALPVDLNRAANLCVDISTVYYTESNYMTATSYCFQGLKMLKPTSADSLFFKVYSSLGEMYNRRYMSDSTIYFFGKANILVENHPKLIQQIPDYVLYSYNNQSQFHFFNDDYVQGIALLNKAFQIAEVTQKVEDAAILSNNLAKYYEILGKYPQAFEARQKALRLYTKQDLTRYQFYSGLGWDSFLLGRYTDGIQYLEKALRVLAYIQAQQPNPYYEANTLNHLGRCFEALGNNEMAKKLFSKSLQIVKQNGIIKGKVVADSELGLGRLAQRLVDYKTAAKHFLNAEKACRYDETMPNATLLESALAPQPLFEVLGAQASLQTLVFEKTNHTDDLRKAVEAYLRLIRLSTQIRINFPNTETKLLNSQKTFQYFEKAIELTYQLWERTAQPLYQNQLFSLIEHSHAATLRDALQEQHIKPKFIAEEKWKEEQRLQQEITQITNKIASGQNYVQLTAFRQQLDNLHIKRNSLLRLFERQFPQYYQAKYLQEVATVKDVQQFLHNEEVFVTYFWKAPHLYIVCINQNQIVTKRVSIASHTFEQAITQLNKSLYQNPGLGRYAACTYSISLYKWLITPITPQLKTHTRFIVSKDAAFSLLPFEVLESGRIEQDFLAKQVAIRYTYSATTLVKSFKPQPYDLKVLAIAPFARSGFVGLRQLPASADEAQQIGDVALLNEQATKAAFTRALSKYQILYLATHAKANDSLPDQSYLAFWPKTLDYRLLANEIYDLDLRHTYLTVLGSCEGGSGKVHRGEGVLSLARALTYAGCPSVISTLWPAHDQTTSFLSKQTFEYIHQGLPLDVAIQKARYDFWASPLSRKYNHPYYWANWVLVGHETPLSRTNLTTYWGWIAALLLAVSGGLYYYYYWNKRNQ